MKNLKEQVQTAVNIFKSGNLSKAEEETKKLIAENPKVAFLYNLLGLISVEQKKIELAEEYYKKGLSIDPNFAIISFFADSSALDKFPALYASTASKILFLRFFMSSSLKQH